MKVEHDKAFKIAKTIRLDFSDLVLGDREILQDGKVPKRGWYHCDAVTIEVKFDKLVE